MTDDMDLTTLAKDIARELGKLRGETWTSGEGWHNTQRRLTGPDGAELFVNSDSWRTRGQGRLTAHGDFPRTNASLRSAEDISVAATRGPAVIAKEINRRLLPGYLARLAEVLKFNETEQAQYEARGMVLNEVAALFGTTYKQEPYDTGRSGSYRDSLSLYSLPGSLYGSIEVSGTPDTLKLDIHSVPPETALRMLAVLADDVRKQS